jgi:hypothetical protein
MHENGNTGHKQCNTNTGSCEHGNEHLASLAGKEKFTGWLRDC